MSEKIVKAGEFLLDPKGSILDLFTDPRVIATAGGAVVSNFVETQIIVNQRKVFGVKTVTISGDVVYVDAGRTTAPTKADDKPKYMQNRALLNLALTALCVAGIKVLADMPSEKQARATAQYFLLGVAGNQMAHLAQAVFPVLNEPFTK